MIAVGVDFGGLVDLPGAIARGRAAAMPKMAKWVADQVRANIAAQRDPWGRGWRPKSRRSDGGSGPALTSFAGKVREESTATSWNVVIDDEHASTHQFGRARKGDRRSRPRRGEARVRPDGTAWRASRAQNGEPARAMLPLRVRSSGRQEPLVDFPLEWARELDRILDAEIQREIDALRPGTSSTASAA